MQRDEIITVAVVVVVILIISLIRIFFLKYVMERKDKPRMDEENSRMEETDFKKARVISVKKTGSESVLPKNIMRSPAPSRNASFGSQGRLQTNNPDSKLAKLSSQLQRSGSSRGSYNDLNLERSGSFKGLNKDPEQKQSPLNKTTENLNIIIRGDSSGRMTHSRSVSSTKSSHLNGFSSDGLALALEYVSIDQAVDSLLDVKPDHAAATLVLMDKSKALSILQAIEDTEVRLTIKSIMDKISNVDTN